MPTATPIAPMLAAAGMLPTGPGWAYEFKYGVRALAYVEPAAVRVLSRNGNDVTRAYPELAECVRLLGGRHAVLDGEIVALENRCKCSYSDAAVFPLLGRNPAGPGPQGRWAIRSVAAIGW